MSSERDELPTMQHERIGADEWSAFVPGIMPIERVRPAFVRYIRQHSHHVRAQLHVAESVQRELP